MFNLYIFLQFYTYYLDNTYIRVCVYIYIYIMYVLVQCIIVYTIPSYCYMFDRTPDLND